MRSKSCSLKVEGPKGTLFLNFGKYKALNVQNFINQTVLQFMSLCSRTEYKLIGLKAGINKSNADEKCVRLVIYSTSS